MALPRELETCTRATLVYDLATIDANLTALARAARASGIRPLFAVKSFPDPRVIALAAEHLDGFDVASPGEIAAVPSGAIVSICDPSGLALGYAPASTRVIASIETPAQLAAAPAHAEIAIRISASITGRDPAVGAILDGSGHRRSRFGLDDRAPPRDGDRARDAIAELVGLAGDRRLGLHLHHGPVTATSAERFIVSARAALALVDRMPSFLNLGGAWHGLADLPGAFAQIRAALPRDLELLVEPGRLLAARAGFAAGRITAARSLGDRELRVTELSRTCHLRWSPVELVAPPPRTGHGVKVLIAGPSCYEEDVLGEWTIEPAVVDERVILRDVSGYALAWNTGFGGIPPADVVVR